MISNFYVLAIFCIFLSNASEETETPVETNEVYLNFELSENEKQLVENEKALSVEREETNELKTIREKYQKRFVKAMDAVKLECDQPVGNSELKTDQFIENEGTLSIEQDGRDETDGIREEYQSIRKISLKKFANSIDEDQSENAELKLKSGQSENDEHQVETQECYICNEEMNEKFQYCEHLDHASCLICAQKWIEKNGQDSCPVCRTEFGGPKDSNSPRIENRSNYLRGILLNLSEALEMENALRALSLPFHLRDRQEMDMENAIRESLNPIRQNPVIREAPRSNFVPTQPKCFQCNTERATCKKSPSDTYGFCENCVISQIVEEENLGKENNILNPETRPRRSPGFFCRIFCCRKTKPANQKRRLNKM